MGESKEWRAQWWSALKLMGRGSKKGKAFWIFGFWNRPLLGEKHTYGALQWSVADGSVLITLWFGAHMEGFPFKVTAVSGLIFTAKDHQGKHRFHTDWRHNTLSHCSNSGTLSICWFMALAISLLSASGRVNCTCVNNFIALNDPACVRAIWVGFRIWPYMFSHKSPSSFWHSSSPVRR